MKSAKTEMVTIPKVEYIKLKKKAKLDMALVKDITQGLKDVLAGRIKEV